MLLTILRMKDYHEGFCSEMVIDLARDAMCEVYDSFGYYFFYYFFIKQFSLILSKSIALTFRTKKSSNYTEITFFHKLQYAKLSLEKSHTPCSLTHESHSSTSAAQWFS